MRPFRNVAVVISAAVLSARPLAAQDPHAGHAAHADTSAPRAGAPSAHSPATGHAAHAAARPASTRADATAVRVLRAEVVARGEGGGAAVQGGETELRVRVTDPATGQPVSRLLPSAWIDVRRSAGATTQRECEQRIGALNESAMMVKHGQISLATPVEDLNGHVLAVLARQPVVAVIDPLKGFGRTRLLAAVPLPAPGADWASTPDDRLLFVSIPDSGVVAVIDTHDWKVRARIPAGTRPMRVAMQPGGRRVWVSTEGAEPGVAVIDAERLEVVSRLAAGAGPHAIAFSDDGALAFVTARGAGTVTIADAASARVAVVVRTGDAPVDVAWSPTLRQAFVANQGDGTVAVIDPARGAMVGRIQFAPGIASIRFAPEAADAHAAHGDADAGPRPGGRLAFIVNPRAGTLELYDAVTRRSLRSLSGAAQVDQVTFTSSFAYVRAAGTPQVAMIPLANPTAGATGAHDAFPAGDRAPGAVGDSIGDVLVAQPGMHDAVYVANPAERMVYSYHYMEGMPVPHGGLTTYEYVPRAVRAVSRRLRETEPGVYAATVRLEDAGDYDLVLRSADPHVVGCYGFRIAADPNRPAGETLTVEAADPARKLPVGPATVRLKLVGPGGAPVDGVGDVRVTLAAPGGWQRRVDARAAGGGVYEAAVEVPAPGLYAAAVDIPSLGVTSRGRRPLYFQAEAR
ncbi:MAG TPA: cytochrome D1 domain-containing protein [Longimicrobium sp.]